jgi:hypothetical protein
MLRDAARRASSRGASESAVAYLRRALGEPPAAADRVELLLGRDLQFIRINGTVVGGLAGLALYTISRVIG